MLTNRKITTYTDNIKAISDTPSSDGINAETLKAKFDGRTDAEIKTSINGIVDDLTATTDGASGADQIGATPLRVGGASTPQGIMEELDNGKVDKIAGKGLSTNDFTIQNKAKLEGVEENANNYSLPTASASTLGGIKIGTGLEILEDGTVNGVSAPAPDLVAREAIAQEIIDRANADLLKQNITDNGLSTTSKQIVGAINEVNISLSEVKEDLGNVDDVITTPVELRGKDIVTRVNELFTSASNGKTLIANAITGKNVPTSPTDTYQQMADNIGELDPLTKTYLYKDGNEYTDLTGGWEQYVGQYSGGTVTKNVDNIYMYSTAGDKNAATQTKSSIDLTNYSKLTIKIDVLSWRNEGNYLGIFPSKINFDGRIALLSFLSVGESTYELDISSINQSVYIRVNANAASQSMYELLIE